SLPAAQCTTSGVAPRAKLSNMPPMRGASQAGSTRYSSIIASNMPAAVEGRFAMSARIFGAAQIADGAYPQLQQRLAIRRREVAQYAGAKHASPTHYAPVVSVVAAHVTEVAGALERENARARLAGANRCIHRRTLPE